MKTQKQYDYDLIVIGSGAGGSVAAHIANKAGKNVALIEASLVGGECPNIGCVPTKALLHAAEVYEAAKHGSRFGLRASTVGYNYPSIKAWKDLAVKRTGTYLGEEMYTSEGISLLRGNAHFVDPHTITLGNARFSAQHFVIATGSQLVIPPIEGLEKAGFITFREAIDLTRPPRNLAVIGGGAIGCEFSQLFAIFGTKVHIIDIAPQLLAREDHDAGTFLQHRFQKQYSISSHLETSVTKIETSGTKKHLTLKHASGGTSRITVDEILLATGKRAVVDIGLENAGVSYQNGSITVNQHLQTTTPHIYAAGDCVGPYQFTHMATYQSRIAAHNLLHPRKKLATDYRAVPRCIFTNPEIASVGATEQELIAQKSNFKKAQVSITAVGRANTSDVSEGFVKVLADTKTGALLGATIASPHAGEMIHELALAIQNNMRAEQVADTIHAFPTWSEAVRVACAKLARV